MQKILLATQSSYKKQLLERLNIPFDSCAPNIDETILDNEPPAVAAKRLAKAKAKRANAIASGYDLIISGDQIASFENKKLGKPHTKENAIEQLMSFSGKKVMFYTGVTVFSPKQNEFNTELDVFEVKFRQLSLDEVTRYIDIEQPLDCAGSFKSEGLGIALFENLTGNDPTGLIGLPLIKVSKMLRSAGLSIP